VRLWVRGLAVSGSAVIVFWSRSGRFGHPALAAFFGGHDAPSTLLGVTVLVYRDQLVEVEAVAVTAAARDGGRPS